jgi:transposase
MEKTMTLNPQEQQRIQVLNQHLRGELSIDQVAALLSCTQRQVYRLKASYREQGVEAVIHGNRGKRSPRRIKEATRKQVSRLAQERYAGCNQHHLRDVLEERDGIEMSRASVRRILEEEGVLVVQARTRRTHRLRRPRYRQEGQLIQIDASPHDWLQERGPRLSLVGGIDDATGKVVGAVFREQEDQQGYMHMLRQVVEQYGCPQALYHDRHTMFPTSRHDATQQHSTQEQLAGSRTSTQLGRLFQQLQITSIAARSPQAKGRIERLWGTFQDRLVSELRLAGATTLHEANVLVQEYLPRFNARFAVPATDPGLATPAGYALA